MKGLLINQYLRDYTDNYDILILQVLKDLDIECSDIRWLFKDKSGVVLLYPNTSYKIISGVKDKLANIVLQEESVFTVSGNGWGTGLSIMCSYPKIKLI